MEVVCAIDEGTTSTRFIVYDKDAHTIASSQLEFKQYHPHSGWTEHDAMEILDAVNQTVADGLKAAEAKVGGRVKPVALGITNQRETAVAWDRVTGQPLCKAIVWLDNRTADICTRMTHELGTRDYFRARTGLPISTYFSGYKYKWMLENVPAVADAAKEDRCCFGTIDAWLIYHLTGGAKGGRFVTDVSNASRTNLLDINSLQWDEDLFPYFGVKRSMLPDIVSNAEVYGHVAAGPLADVPIAGCLGDQMAAMLGQRCKVDEAKNTYGTGCFMLLNTGSEVVPSRHGLLTTLAYKLGRDAPANYALEGAIAIAGAGVAWLRDGMGIVSSASESEKLAAQVPSTAGVYFVPAFSGLLAPHWRSDARGAILGLTQYTTKAHIARAMLEALAWQTREVLDAMRADADLSQLKLLRVDGGAAANGLLLQLQADTLQVPVVRPADAETTALGAAYAAGIGVGFWSQEWVLSDRTTAPATTFQPKADKAEIERRYKRWNKAVQRSFDLADLIEENGNKTEE